MADRLTAEGWRSARTGGDLTDRMVQALIRKHGLCYRRRLRIADVVARQPGEETVLEAANPSSRIRRIMKGCLVANQRVGGKGLHYSEVVQVRVVEVILGGGCGGRRSLSWPIRSWSSGSGCV